MKSRTQRKKTPAGAPTVFEREAAEALARLQRAVVAILDAFPVPAILQPADLRKVLRVGRRPLWQLFRFAYAPDPFSEGHNVPGPAPMRQILRQAAGKHGVSGKLIREAEAAYQAYLRLVETHADDRQSFDSLVGGLAGAGAEALDLLHKRGAYRHNSHLFGVQARGLLQCTIWKQSEEGSFDCVLLQGFVSLRRFRPVVIPMMSSFTYGESDRLEMAEGVHIEPLVDRSQLFHGISLLRGFCSRPLPELRVQRYESGAEEKLLLPRGLGSQSAITYMVGDVFRGSQNPREEAKPMVTSHAGIKFPVEVLINDVLLVRGELPVTGCQVAVYRRSPAALSDPRLPLVTESNTLATRESVVHLGTGAALRGTPEIPRYPEMVAYACRQMGWSPESFDVYRCRVEFPVVGTWVMVQCDLRSKRSSRKKRA